MSTPSSPNLSRDLPTLLRINKTQFISSYIREQKVHAKSYASEGRALMSSWNTTSLEGQTTKPPTPAIQALADCGFGTPVLKSRAALKETLSKDLPSKPRTKYQPIAAHGKENKRKRSSIGIPNPPPRSKSRPRQVATKQASSVHSDTEHSKRMKERRERKRAKRAIVKPIEVHSESESERTNKRKKKTEKSKVPTGFALMHGFSATNVGAGRLTMKLPVGVFNKGKASAKTQVRYKKLSKTAGHQNTGFSEEAFLTRARPKQKSAKRAPLPSSVSDTDRSTADIDTLSCAIRSKQVRLDLNIEKNRREASSHTSDIIVDETSVVGKPSELLQSIAARAESIVWDVELDDASLPSRTVPSDPGHGTVILITQNLTWTGQQADIPDKRVNAATPPLEKQSKALKQADIRTISSPSIGPSQSASQCGATKPQFSALSQPIASSKYFTTIKRLLPHRPVSAVEPLNVDPAPRPTTGGTKPVKSLFVPDQIVYTAAKLQSELAPPTPLMLRASERRDVEQNCYIDIDTDMGYYAPEPEEDFKDTMEDVHLEALACSFDEGYETHTPVPHRKHTNEGDVPVGYHDGDSCVDEEAFDFQVTLAYSPTQPDFGYLQSSQFGPGCLIDGDSFLGISVVETFGQCFEVRDFEYEDEFEREDGYSDELYDNIEYSELGSEGGQRVQFHTETQAIYNDAPSTNASSWISRSDYGMESESGFESDYGYGLAHLTTRFSQGRDLLLGHLENDGHEGLGSTQVVEVSRTRRPVSLVEADVAKNLRNHWLPQKND